MDNQIILYGFVGPEENRRVARYFVISNEDASIWYLRHAASNMRMLYPSIVEVYAVDNRRGLKSMFMDAFKHPTIENSIGFRDWVEREGIRIF